LFIHQTKKQVQSAGTGAADRHAGEVNVLCRRFSRSDTIQSTLLEAVQLRVSMRP
jgi:hypothetical protein